MRERSNTEQCALLRSSVKRWNSWRKQSPESPIDLKGADLSGCDLIEANLAGADLTRASLAGALLLGADLSGASLSKADLRSADLRAAKLSGADLTDGLFLTQSQLIAAVGDDSTQVPSGVSRPEHWR